MNIGVTGSSGLVGSALVPYLIAAGHHVLPISREKGSELLFRVEDSSASYFDAVVHLAGEPIASGRWTKAKKVRIQNSRVMGTSSLCHALAQLEHPPKTLISASAIGYYGDRGDELLDENGTIGTGFLSQVVEAWEHATTPAVERGIRVACLRFGMILSLRGGALAEMLPPFRYGFGGRLGHGRQFWSWISLHDALAAIHHVLNDESLSGPINVVSPQSVRNAEFTSILGRVLKRPTFAALPAWMVRSMFGRMGKELLLASVRAVPRRLIAAGFSFQDECLDRTLEKLLSE